VRRGAAAHAPAARRPRRAGARGRSASRIKRALAPAMSSHVHAHDAAAESLFWPLLPEGGGGGGAEDAHGLDDLEVRAALALRRSKCRRQTRADTQGLSACSRSSLGCCAGLAVHGAGR
jgi:hypothetical protein